MHDIGHDLQRPAAARPYRGLVFLELDPGFLDDRLSQLDTSFSGPRVDEEKCCRKRLHATPAHHEMVACNPERNRDAFARGCHELLEARRVLATEHQLTMRIVESREEMIEESSPDN